MAEESPNMERIFRKPIMKIVPRGGRAPRHDGLVLDVVLTQSSARALNEGTSRYLHIGTIRRGKMAGLLQPYDRGFQRCPSRGRGKETHGKARDGCGLGV